MTHDPNDRTLTFRPERPSRRYSISMGDPFCAWRGLRPTYEARRLASRVRRIAAGDAVTEVGPAPTSPLFQIAWTSDHFAGVGGVDDFAATHVHADVVDAAVPPEDEVAGLQVRQRDVGHGVVLRRGGAGQVHPGLAPGPLGEARTVEAPSRALATPDVGHADLALGGGERGGRHRPRPEGWAG